MTYRPNYKDYYRYRRDQPYFLFPNEKLPIKNLSAALVPKSILSEALTTMYTMPIVVGSTAYAAYNEYRNKQEKEKQAARVLAQQQENERRKLEEQMEQTRLQSIIAKNQVDQSRMMEKNIEQGQQILNNLNQFGSIEAVNLLRENILQGQEMLKDIKKLGLANTEINKEIINKLEYTIDKSTQALDLIVQRSGTQLDDFRNLIANQQDLGAKTLDLLERKILPTIRDIKSGQLLTATEMRKYTEVYKTFGEALINALKDSFTNLSNTIDLSTEELGLVMAQQGEHTRELMTSQTETYLQAMTEPARDVNQIKELMDSIGLTSKNTNELLGDLLLVIEENNKKYSTKMDEIVNTIGNVPKEMVGQFKKIQATNEKTQRNILKLISDINESINESTRTGKSILSLSNKQQDMIEKIIALQDKQNTDVMKFEENIINPVVSPIITNIPSPIEMPARTIEDEMREFNENKPPIEVKPMVDPRPTVTIDGEVYKMPILGKINYDIPKGMTTRYINFKETTQKRVNNEAAKLIKQYNQDLRFMSDMDASKKFVDGAKELLGTKWVEGPGLYLYLTNLNRNPFPTYFLTYIQPGPFRDFIVNKKKITHDIAAEAYGKKRPHTPEKADELVDEYIKDTYYDDISRKKYRKNFNELKSDEIKAVMEEYDVKTKKFDE